MSIKEVVSDINVDFRVVGTLASPTLCRVFRVKHVMCILLGYARTHIPRETCDVYIVRICTHTYST